jgi:hypothetical protein
MEKITVEKAALLEKLRENRANHRAIFEEAMDGFQAQAERELKALLSDLRKGVRQTIRMNRSVPSDHTMDYDRAVAMIEMSLGDTITLSENDFAQYVMDDWGWQDQFLSNTYGSKTAASKFSDRYTVG